MNISKISRSIVVVMFIVLVLFFIVLGVANLFNLRDDVAVSSTSPLIKFGFGSSIVIFTFVYVYIKDKLYKMHIKRKLSFIYRYIYIVFILLGAAIFSLKNVLLIIPDYKIFLHMFFVILSSLIIKKIVFNVSKSDVLSVIAMFGYAFFPNIILQEEFYFSAMIFNIVFLSFVLVFQILIDELKQKGIKTKKYIIQTVFLGIFMGIASVIGANIYMFIAILLVSILVTYNLDNTHINFPSKFMASLTQARREKLYKIERININKIFVVVILSVCLLLVCNMIFSYVINGINLNNNTVNVLKDFSGSFKLSDINYNIKDMAKNFINISKLFIKSSSLFYIVNFSYIIFMEILAFCLHRKYDTKSTIMKFIFITLFISIVVFELNIYYFEPILTILLILIAIVNTSNIYLNREERIKMLVA